MQRHSRLLIEELARDENLKLIVIHPHLHTRVFKEQPAVVEIVADPGKSSGRYLVDCYRYSKKVFAILQQYPRAIIYAQGLTVWYHIGKIGNRVIVNPHGLEPFQTISLKDKMVTLPFRIIFSSLFRQAGAVVSLGGRLTGILQNLLGDNRDKIAVLPNAVNIPPPMQRSCVQQCVKFLFVGRFAFNKGIGVLLEAVRQLNQAGYGDKMFFDLVGKGPLFDKFKNTYQAPNINFAGFADDDKLVELYKTNDVFVLPTLFEGMPTVVLEAMCYSMPVIVTDVGATRELVDDKNGFIIEKNDVQSLKHALIKYFNSSPVERKMLADHAYLKVKDNFTWPVVAEKHKKLFYQMENKRRTTESTMAV